MNIKTLPGTIIEVPRSLPALHALTSSLFSSGGLSLAQASGLTDLSPHVLQNWVKRGFVPPPVNKKYSQSHFYRIAIINFLKENLRIDLIVKLIKYVDMSLPDSNVDSVDDTVLYHYFMETLFLADNYIDKLDAAIKIALRSFNEPYPGARVRLAAVIRIMIVLFMSSQIKDSAGLLLRNIGLLD